MSARALAQPAKVSSFDVRAASSAAMKNVLSPISERKMSEKDGARSAERLSSAAYAARLSRTASCR